MCVCIVLNNIKEDSINMVFNFFFLEILILEGWRILIVKLVLFFSLKFNLIF